MTVKELRDALANCPDDYDVRTINTLVASQYNEAHPQDFDDEVPLIDYITIDEWSGSIIIEATTAQY